ncbi:MAG: hypothetical protein FJ243_03015, partial [Nitrospira sp.]|nr:hypothetical protein [Nitrospira sp.]
MRVEAGRETVGGIYLFLRRSSFIPIIAIFLYSCAAVTSVSESRHSHVIENVPFYPQSSYQCGPASLAGVLNYWGARVTPDEIAEEIYSTSIKGTLDMDMVIYAQTKDVQAIQYRGSMEDLRRNIQSGYPLIVLVDYGFGLYQSNHFMVVTGYNESGLIVNS